MAPDQGTGGSQPPDPTTQRMPFSEAGAQRHPPDVQPHVNFLHRWCKWFQVQFHQYLLFGYFSPFMRLAKTGGSEAVRPENLPELWPSDNVDLWANRFCTQIDRSAYKSSKFFLFSPSPQTAVFSTVTSVFWLHLTGIICIKIVLTLLSLTSVFMMTSFLEWQELDPNTATAAQRTKGVLSGLGILFLELSYIFIGSQCSFWIERVSLRIQSSLIAGLFHTMVNQTPDAKRKDTTQPSAYNILMVDIGSVAGFIFAVIDILILPVKILLSYPLLANRVGAAASVGLGTLLSIMSVMLLLEIRSGLLKTPYLRNRDSRLARCHETVLELRGLRMLGWEDTAAQRIESSRATEMHYRRKRMYLDTVAAVLSNGAYIFTQVAIFAAYILWATRRNPAFVFKASVAIPVVQVVGRLVGPFTNLPFIVNSLIEGWISSERYYTRVFNSRKFSSLGPENSSHRGTQTNLCPPIASPWEVSPLLDDYDRNAHSHITVDGCPSALIVLTEDASSDTESSDAIPFYPPDRILVERALFSWDESITEKRNFAIASTGHDHHAASSVEIGKDNWASAGEGVPVSVGEESRSSVSTHMEASSVNHYDISIEGDDAVICPEKNTSFNLLIPQLEIRPGQCVAVSGTSGSGKSSVVLALLGEMPQYGGKCCTGGRQFVNKSCLQQRRSHNFGNANVLQSCCIGYASQVPWIPEGTVRSIILFGRPFDKVRYSRVIRACELEVDLQSWAPEGDQRTIPEGGVNLSGGQRSRIGLARALYGYPDPTDSFLSPSLVTPVVLLDDSFGSIDPSVAPLIFKNIFGENGVLQYAATLLTIDETSFMFCSQFLRLEKQYGVSLTLYVLKDNVLLPSKVITAESTISRTSYASSVKSDKYETASELTASGDFRSALTDAVWKTTETHNAAAFCKEEVLSSGAVKMSTYWWYTKKTGYLVLIIMGCLIFIAHLTSFGSDIWLAYWTYIGAGGSPETNAARKVVTEPGARFLTASNPVKTKIVTSAVSTAKTVASVITTRFKQNMFGLYVYSMLSFSSVIALLILYILGIYAALRAAITIHGNLLHSVIKAPYWMYDFLPVGIVVNRFNSDIDIVDGGPLLSLSYFFSSCVYFFMVIIGLSLLSPWCSPLIPLVAFLVYTFVYRLFRPTCRELQRSRLTALSPLCGHLSEVESGAVLIRAFSAQKIYQEKNLNLTSNLMKTQFMQTGSSSWATTRLQLLSFPFTVLNSVVPIILRCMQLSAPVEFLAKLVSQSDNRAFTSSAGFVGIGISFALALPSSIGALVWSFSSLEQKMCSVQRVETLVKELGSASNGVDAAYNEDISGGGFYDWKSAGGVFSSSKSPPVCNELQDHTRSKLLADDVNNLQDVEGSVPSHCSPKQPTLADLPLGPYITYLSELPSKRTGIKIRSLEVCYQKLRPRAAREAKTNSPSSSSPPSGLLQLSEKPALRNVTASARPGEAIGIVGRTGSGKTTFLLALLNLLPATRGFIFIDNIPLQRFSPPLLKKIVGILPQFPPVLRGWTVRKFLDPENEFPLERLYKAVKQVGLQYIVRRLPYGLDTVILPSAVSDPDDDVVGFQQRVEGPSLSDSQLRMLTLARLSLHADTYRLVLVDEPPPRQLGMTKLPASGETQQTKAGDRMFLSQGEAGATMDIDEKSSVSAKARNDEEGLTEELGIGDIMKRLFPNSIIFVVAHHATTFKHCNRLWVFSRGELKGIEKGSTMRSQEQLTDLIRKYELKV